MGISYSLRAVLPLLLLAAAPTLPASGIHKWVDERGRTHYGDRPPPGDSQEMVIKELPKSGDNDLENRQIKQKRLLDVLARERQEKREHEDKEKREKELREKNCAIAKERLEQINQSNYLFQEGKQGDRRIYSFEEREKALVAARNEVKKWCS